MQGYDYIIVGAGSAGCAIAGRLSEDPNCRVLLLEAGISDKDVMVRKPGMIMIMHTVDQIKAKYDWGYYTKPNPLSWDRKIPYTRGKVMGGCSSVNGMVWVRGNRQNFDDWAAEGNTGWGYDDILPLYKKMESFEDGENAYRGGSGPIQVQRAPNVSPIVPMLTEAIAAGTGTTVNADYNGESQEGASIMQINAKNGLRYNTNVAYIEPHLDRPNLTVQLCKQVTRIVIEGDKAVGVELVSTKGEVEKILCDKEVIVSGGTVGSPQLLMLSGIGPKKHLEEMGIPCVADLPVGENLHDHLFFPITFRSPKSNNKSTAFHMLKGLMKEFIGGGNSFLAKSMFEAVAFVRSGNDSAIPDLQIHALPWGYPSPNQDAPGIPKVDKKPCITVQPTLIYPKSRGTITLRSNNPMDAPIIDPNYLAAPEDADTLMRGIELVREIMAQPGIRGDIDGEISPGPEFFTSDAMRKELPNRIATVYHPVGTCRMGVDDYAVVDPQLRVRGIRGLRVADASIMPTITGGNTNAPAIMIGEKCAEMIKAGL